MLGRPMDRVLKVVPSELRSRMEALVQDLSTALEESAVAVRAGPAGGERGSDRDGRPGHGSSSGGARRRWGLRRRALSAGSLPAVAVAVAVGGRRGSGGRRPPPALPSDESSSSSSGPGGDGATPRGGGSGGADMPMGGVLSSLQHSDSDEAGVGAMSGSGALDATFSAFGGCSSGAARSLVLSGSGLGGALCALSALGSYATASGAPPESDSFNEAFSRGHPRRKRKCKRMAVDPVGGSVPAIPLVPAGPPLPVPRPPPAHKRRMRHGQGGRRANCENRLGYVLLCGKRKRSARERGALRSDFSSCCERRYERRRTHHVLALRKLSLSDSAPTAGDMVSSSSLSSSESDAGIYTNDEGREGDDEQSDWVGGGGGWWDDGEDGSPDRMPSSASRDSSFSSLIGSAFLGHGLGHSLEERGRPRLQGMSGREIRAGRRRLRPERPGFSVLTSANEKLSRFLQDGAQSELRLHPMQAPERVQLGHLAALYSLHMRTDGNSRPVLTKTQDTMRAVRVDQLHAGCAGGGVRKGVGAGHGAMAAADFKRRRRLPPGQLGPPPPPAPSPDDSQPMDVAGPTSEPRPPIGPGWPSNQEGGVPLSNLEDLSAHQGPAPPTDKSS